MRATSVRTSDTATPGEDPGARFWLTAAPGADAVVRATDVARAAADMILLANVPNVVADGIIEGRCSYGNIIMGVRMGTTPNFGNMLSMALVAPSPGPLATALLLALGCRAALPGFAPLPPALLGATVALAAACLACAQGFKRYALDN